MSYVINDGPRPVAPATRARVEAAVAELGYRPNTAGRALRTRRTGTIGVVVPSLTIAFFARLVDALERQADACGVRAMVGLSRFSAVSEADCVARMIAADADALVVAGAGRRCTIPESPTRVVFVHHRPTGGVGPLVHADDHRAGRLAAAHLGVDRPVVLLGSGSSIGPVARRVRGIRAELRARGARDAATVAAPYDRRAARDALGAALPRLPRRFGLVALTDEHALGALAAVHLAERSIPDDVAVVTIDGTDEVATTVPRLSSVALPVDDLASSAIELALDPDAVEPAPLDVRLVPAATTAPR